jgi:superfamily II DNA/RNA helicase
MEGKKSQSEILSKLGIEALNAMQVEALEKIATSSEIILLSPTGTGKTLAFLLPIVAKLEQDTPGVQALIMAPSRELATQIAHVMQEMGTGFKANAVYGGRPLSQDKIDLKHPPTVLIGTPGRIADHIRRASFSTAGIHTLVLDEFDKSLEVGFETEMTEIMAALPNLTTKILTSATKKIDVPNFVRLKNPVYLNFLKEKASRLKLKTIEYPKGANLLTLVTLLQHLEGKPGVVFCNFRETVEQVHEYLNRNQVPHGCFFGGMEQQDREQALIKFRNGTHRVLLATDLAARGIDVPEIQFVVHYELPAKAEEFIHRNGRTARMMRDGAAYIMKWSDKALPEFMADFRAKVIPVSELSKTRSDATLWTTLYVTGGRRDKISKGDIAGLFIKQGKLTAEQLGRIEVKPDCAYVAVQADLVNRLLPLVNNAKLKTKKVRITVLE